MKVTFSVPGIMGKIRPRVVRNGGRVTAYTPQKDIDYERLVQARYLAAGGHRWNEKEPISIHLVAVFPVPKSYPQKQQREISEGHLLPCKKPDIDNIAKIVLDGLNGVAYRDDAQICTLEAHKEYSKDLTDQEGYLKVTLYDGQEEQ